MLVDGLGSRPSFIPHHAHHRLRLTARPGRSDWFKPTNNGVLLPLSTPEVDHSLLSMLSTWTYELEITAKLESPSVHQR